MEALNKTIVLDDIYFMKDELYILKDEEENLKYYKKLIYTITYYCHDDSIPLIDNLYKETYKLDKIVEFVFGLYNFDDEKIYNLIKEKIQRYNLVDEFDFNIEIYDFNFIKNKNKIDKINLYNNYKFFYKVIEFFKHKNWKKQGMDMDNYNEKNYPDFEDEYRDIK